MNNPLNVIFSMKSWDEKTVRPLTDTTLKQATVCYQYTGDFTGESEAEFLLLYLPDGTASFTAVERIEGIYDNAPFTMVLTHHGLHEDNIAKGTCEVAAATGSLKSYSGTGTYRADDSTVALALA
jgi:hypothetical protein